MFSLVLLIPLLLGVEALTRLGDSDYYVSINNASYLEAEFMCQSTGRQLVRFDNEEQFDTFNSTMDTWGLSPLYSYWMGALRLENGLWYWSSNKAVMVYSNWAATQTSCTTTSTLCCLTLAKETSRLWYARNCCENYLYICEPQR